MYEYLLSSRFLNVFHNPMKSHMNSYNLTSNTVIRVHLKIFSQCRLSFSFFLFISLVRLFNDVFIIFVNNVDVDVDFLYYRPCISSIISVVVNYFCYNCSTQKGRINILIYPLAWRNVCHLPWIQLGSQHAVRWSHYHRISFVNPFNVTNGWFLLSLDFDNGWLLVKL